MTILINKKLNLTVDATRFIKHYIKYVQTVNPRDVYEGLSNKKILQNKFIFHINQIENLDLADVSVNLVDGEVQVLASFWNSKPVVVGSVSMTAELKKALEQDSYPTLQITGGNYKKVVTNEYGEDEIQDGFTPYQLSLEIHEADPVIYKSRKIDTVYHYAFKSEQSLIKASKILMTCFAIFGLLLGLGFMFLGFFLTGLMVIIAFFGVNSYTLLLADAHAQVQPQEQQ